MTRTIVTLSISLVLLSSMPTIALAPGADGSEVFPHVSIDFARHQVSIPVRFSPHRQPCQAIVVNSKKADQIQSVMATDAAADDLHRALILVGVTLPGSARQAEAIIVEYRDGQSGRQLPLHALLGLREDAKFRFVGTAAVDSARRGVLIDTDNSSGSAIVLDGGSRDVKVSVTALRSGELIVRPAGPAPAVVLLDRFGRTWLRNCLVAGEVLARELKKLRKDNDDLHVRVIFDRLSIQTDRRELLDALQEIDLHGPAVQSELADRRYLLEQVTFPANDPRAGRQLLGSQLHRRAQLAEDLAEHGRDLSNRFIDQVSQLQQMLQAALRRLSTAQNYYRRLATQPAGKSAAPAR